MTTLCRTMRTVKLCLPTALCLAVLGGTVFPCCGQMLTAGEPDYSHVSDILAGRRTLLQENDLIVTAFRSKGTTPSSGAFTATIMNTANGQVSAVQPTTAALSRGDDRINKLFAGRFYQSDHDLLIRAVPTAYFRPYLLLTDGATPVTESFLPGGANKDVTFSAALGDFNGDGYADFVVNFGPGDELGKMTVFSGAKPDGSKNLRFGPTRTQADGQETLLAMTAGDFDGDGKMEIAGLAYKRTGRYVLEIYKVDPATLAIAKASELMPSYAGEDPSQPISYFSMASGHFTSAAHNQVVLSYATTTGNVKVAVYDFASGALQPIEKSVFATTSGFGGDGLTGGILQVETGRFSLANPYDQIFFGFAWQGPPVNHGGGARFFEIFQVDPANETLLLKSLVDFSEFNCTSSFSVGNYDKRKTNSSGDIQPALGLQIAVASGACDTTSSKDLRIYGVSSSDYNSTIDYNSALPSDLNSATSLYIDPADLQGRSYALGPPTRVVVNRSLQPSVIAAMPPMHVDFVPPANSSEPEVLNLSVAPSGFNTTYQTNETNTNQSSTVSTTSWSFGAQQSLSVGFEVGSVDAGFGLKGTSVSTAAQDLENSLETEYGEYKQSSFDAGVQTGFSDSVWYSASRFNIWVYPVLGQSVCPAGMGANCQPTQKAPLTIQFSAPDQLEYAKTDGSLLPWYQPIWEPGNVFSYPASYGQLQAIAPNLNRLSRPRSSTTDTSKATENITWTTEATNGSTASFDQNYSFSQEFSLTGAVSTSFASASFTGTLNFSGSNGFSDLNKSVTSVGKSTGIGVNKPGTFADPDFYAYNFTPYILGQAQGGSVVDEEPLNSDVQTHGLLRTAFLADPLAVHPNGWWRQTYNQPDIALNHPQRWRVSSNAAATGNSLPSNCLSTDCVFLQQRNAKNPWLSPIHFMRGFFISNGQSPGQGPQLDTAQAGEILTLQARVYNYSLKEMPAGSHVHVRFYVQPFDKSTHERIGDSILIGTPDADGNRDVVLDPIPPFNDEPGKPLNWVLASTKFDTTPYGGENLVFWIIVWGEDVSGKLIEEMPGHGLESIPGVLTSFADVQMEQQYSNNVGFYNSEFYVFPNAASLTAASSSESATINIGKIQLSSESTMPGQILDVSAQLSATDNSASGVDAVFYDGDPDAGGTAFGYELSPYIAENDTYQVKAPYVAVACGTHELFVVVGQGTSHKLVRRAPPVRVDCSQSRELDFRGKRARSLLAKPAHEDQSRH